MRYFHMLIAGFLLVIIIGCQSGAKVEGYVLIVEADAILLAEDATVEDYEAWKELTHNELIELNPSPSLLKITYEDAQDLNEGDYVTVELVGDIAASYPGQAEAKKVKKN